MAQVTERSAVRWTRTPSDRTALDFLGVASPLYARVAHALEPSGLSYAEYRLLDGLRRSRGALERDRPAAVVTRLAEALDGLEARGLVRSAPAVGGRRFELTSFGLARLNAAAGRLDDLVADFASRLDLSDAVGLGALLTRLGGRA